MAKLFTPKDAAAVMNLLVKQSTGQTANATVDAASFASAGETVLATGYENTINSLGIVIGRTFMAVRPYEAKLRLIDALNTGIFTNRLRKVSFYSQDAKQAGDWNTDLNTNLAMGYTNGQNKDGAGDAKSTKSMWEQTQPVALEMNFSGQDVWQDSITIYENQLAVAFRSAEEFAEFLNGVMVEKANDIESQKEAFNRLAILQKIASVYDMRDAMPGSVINLTKEYNETFGTNYTSAQLRTTYLKEFLAFFVARFKLASKKMTTRSLNYHWSPAKQVDGVAYNLLRHTPYSEQRVLLYSPLFTDAESLVLPEIFNPDYLDIKTQYEEVLFWQSENSPSAINVTPAINNTTTGEQEEGTAVILPYVVGMIFDKDGLMTDFQFEAANTTPVEARKRFRNLWWSFSKNIISDNTEKSIIFVMMDE